MGTDAPDWERVVTTISGGSVSDAPDWQRTVTGPGAAPIGSGGSPQFTQWNEPAQVAVSYPFVLVDAVFTFATNVVQLSLVIARSSVSVSTAWFYLQGFSTNDSTPADNLIGLYSVPGGANPTATLIAQGTIGSLLLGNRTLGYNAVDFTSAVDVTAGLPYYIGIFPFSAAIGQVQTAFRYYPYVGSQGYDYGGVILPWGGYVQQSVAEMPATIPGVDGLSDGFSGIVLPVGLS